MNQQKKYWNERFKVGDIWGNDPCPSAIMSIRHLEESNVTNIFVPGCGYGRNSLYFAQKGFEVIATDISNVAIDHAKYKAKRFKEDKLKYFSNDLFEPFLPHEQKFDAIYLSNVIHLFLERERKELLNKMSSLLKPNGLLIFTCISTTDTKNFGIGKEVEPNTFVYHGKTLHFYTSDEIQEILCPTYQIQEQKLHIQTETDPDGHQENLILRFIVAKKL
ncbi:class I SAM-dependent methyltransferase [Lederbergia sp. NSJ-179]|uniref:class I SAM-dependent methyltransferase n=1 Tax=Lederbergia sp. NSJ-179 TaxID=2931402 RepID=UPI001FD0ABDB|nr:class I SAM-dependent methyltransferase [Lederbergia sp. NSJ-179]MCJ7840245.1 class I SAM-dependent methyltransferase [Lederbergia sp. NSJ-179]